MKKKILFACFFISFLLVFTPITQAVNENTTKDLKNDLFEIISKTKVEDELKDEIINNLEEIEEFDEQTIRSIIRFRNVLEKSNNYDYNNFWLSMSLIHFLWAIYYFIGGETAAAKFQLQRAILDLILYIMLST